MQTAAIGITPADEIFILLRLDGLIDCNVPFVDQLSGLHRPRGGLRHIKQHAVLFDLCNHLNPKRLRSKVIEQQAPLEQPVLKHRAP